MRVGAVLAVFAVLFAPSASADQAGGSHELTYLVRTAYERLSESIVCTESGAARALPVEGHLGTLSWAPRGVRAVLTELVGAEIDTTRLVVAGPKRARRLLPGAAEPDWSPDGRRLAWIASGSLYVSRTDGKRRRLVLPVRGSLQGWHGPEWSRGGRYLDVYDVWVGPVTFWLHRVRPDGRFVGRGRRLPGPATWSPDRRRYAYVYGGDLYVADAKEAWGGTVIASAGDRPVAEAGWSPDGSTIAFVRRAWGGKSTGDVFAVRADGSGLRQVTATPWDEHDVTWRPDGDHPSFGPCLPPG
jgi:TolB protein